MFDGIIIIFNFHYSLIFILKNHPQRWPQAGIIPLYVPVCWVMVHGGEVEAGWIGHAMELPWGRVYVKSS